MMNERNLTLIKDAISGYLEDSCNLSPASINNRRTELSRFARFCKKHEVTESSRLTKNLVIGYLKSLKVAQITKITVLNVLSAFMNYLVDKEIILDNFAASVKMPKARYPESDFLTEHEVAIVFQKVVDISSKKFVDRNLLIFNLLFQICLRATEVCDLKMEDVRLENGDPQIFVFRKGGKQVFIPLNEDLVKLFHVWLDCRKSFQGADLTEWVFLSSHGNQMTRNQVFLLVQNAIKKAGLIKNKMGPHILRHSGGTLLSERGATPQEVQFLMDHDSLNSTQKYLHINKARLRDTVNRMSQIKG